MIFGRKIESFMIKLRKKKKLALSKCLPLTKKSPDFDTFLIRFLNPLNINGLKFSGHTFGCPIYKSLILRHVCTQENRIAVQNSTHNRYKGITQLKKAYKSGKIMKENINKRGYNKFREMSDNVQ